MKKFNSIFIITTFVLLALGSCKKEKPCTDPTNPECENYDPCYGKKAPSADFIIGGVGNLITPYQSQIDFAVEDTIFQNRRIMFTALENDAKYTWSLGAETINDKSFYRTFHNSSYGTFSVKLTIEKEVDITCFLEYTGSATLTKKFETRPYYLFPIMGKYKVLFDGSTDSSIVEIRPYKTSTFWLKWEVLDSMSSDHFAFIGFRNGTDTFDYYRNIDFETGLITGSNIFFPDVGGGGINNGFVKLSNEKVYAEYDARFYAQNPNRRYKFKGRKIEYI